MQVRQRVGHKRTFLYLEQLILKHGAHRGCLSIETFKDGMDFYFPDKGKAARFISFLEDVVPMKVRLLLVNNPKKIVYSVIPMNCLPHDKNYRSNHRKSSSEQTINPTSQTINTPT